MNNRSTQKIALPEPLSAKFKESFAYLTVKDRLPVILTKVLDFLCREKISFRQKYGEEVLEEMKHIIGLLSKLKNHIQTNKAIVCPVKFNSPFKYDDNIIWKEAIDKYIQYNGENPKWFDSSWLFVECYMYKRIQEAFQTSYLLSSYDPFCEQKRMALHGSLNSIKDISLFTLKILPELSTMAQDDLKHSFFKFLQISLWGNMCDLSLSGGSECNRHNKLMDSLNVLEDNILASDMDQIWSHLSSFHLVSENKRTIGLILDNAGFELVSDLCLITFLIESGIVSVVNIHLKTRPWFVSDTTKEDFEYTMDFLKKDDLCKDLVELWQSYIESKRWILKEHIFWTTPHDFSEMDSIDPILYKELQELQFILFKGDLNYRKLVGDYDWPIDTNFRDSLRGFLPSSLAVSRTIKGGAVVGLQPTDNLLKAKEDRDWKVSGNYATIQFCGL